MSLTMQWCNDAMQFYLDRSSNLESWQIVSIPQHPNAKPHFNGSACAKPPLAARSPWTTPDFVSKIPALWWAKIEYIYIHVFTVTRDFYRLQVVYFKLQTVDLFHADVPLHREHVPISISYSWKAWLEEVEVAWQNDLSEPSLTFPKKLEKHYKR